MAFETQGTLFILQPFSPTISVFPIPTTQGLEILEPGNMLGLGCWAYFLYFLHNFYFKDPTIG